MNRVCLKDQNPLYAFPTFFCISNKFLLSPLRFSFSDNFKLLPHHADTVNEAFSFAVHLLESWFPQSTVQHIALLLIVWPDGYLWECNLSH